MVLFVTGWHGVWVSQRQEREQVWTRVRKRKAGRICRQWKQAAGVWQYVSDPEGQEDRDKDRMVEAESNGTGSCGKWEGGRRADIGAAMGAVTGREGDAGVGPGCVS